MGWKEKPAGLKILWIWAFGTAGILVASVMRSRVQEMEKMMKAAEQEHSALLDASDPSASGDVDGEVLRDDKF